MLKLLFILLALLLIIWFIKKNNYIETYINPELSHKIYNDLDNLNSQDLINLDSKYQNIKIVKYDKNKYNINKCLFLDEEIQFCDNEEYKYHEMITHFAASYIKNVRKVLLIGGGDCMTLREIMKYPDINKVTMLELDKEVINASKRYFNVNDYSNDPRVNIIITDATKYIKNLSNNEYDLIIIDTTEDSQNNSPIDTKEFIKLCKNKLNTNGILVKNGEKINNYYYFNSMFKYTDIINYETILYNENTFDYSFILGSNNINFKLSPKYKHNIKLKYYNINNHKKFFMQ